MAYINWILHVRTLQKDKLLTSLLCGSEKFTLNVNKEIIRLIISLLKASERFAWRLFWPKTFVFTFFIYLFFLTIHLFFLYGLTKNDYCISYLSCMSCFVHSFMFHVLFFTLIFNFIFSACKVHWYQKKKKNREKNIRTWSSFYIFLFWNNKKPNLFIYLFTYLFIYLMLTKITDKIKYTIKISSKKSDQCQLLTIK